MWKRLALLATTVALVCAACGSSSPSSQKEGGDSELRDGGSGFSTGGGAPAATAAPRPPSAPSAQGAAGGVGPAGSAASVTSQTATILAVAERKVISSGSMNVEVPDVDAAVTAVSNVATALGGFVESLSNDSKERAQVTIRVPQEQFFEAVARVATTGEVKSRNLGSQDVSDQYVDLQARLKTSKAEEERYLQLLARANSVTEILALERELTRVRGDIERAQGQLNLLERRVALATLTVTLNRPTGAQGVPPSGSVSIKTRDVAGAAATIKGYVAGKKGVVDSSTYQVNQDRAQASLAVRMLPQDFATTMQTVESSGEVLNKSLNEGKPTADGSAPTAKDPNAALNITITEDTSLPWWGVVLAVVIPLLVLALFIGAVYQIIQRGWWPPKRRSRVVATSAEGEAKPH